MTSQMYDPWGAANDPVLPVYNNDLFGRIALTVYPVVLVKGTGKVPFNEQVHNLADRRTAIEMILEPLPELGITNPRACERNLIAESELWRDTVLASIRALGIQNAAEIVGKWVRIELADTGRTYKKDGVDKKETTFKFTAVYPDEATCRAEYFKARGEQPSPAPAAQQSAYQALAQPAPATPTNGNGNGANGEKENALRMLTVLFNNTPKTPETLQQVMTELVTKYPGISKHFTADSPEVIALLAACVF